MSEGAKNDIQDFCKLLIERFPSVVRVEGGQASLDWLHEHAPAVQVMENRQLPPNQILFIDEEGRRIVTVDVTHLRTS